MKKLYIKASKYTPEINFDPETSTLKIKGESYSQDSAVFYIPITEWLTEYLNEVDKNEIKVNIDLNYFNSSSSRTLLEIFFQLEKAVIGGKNIVVNWIYDKDNQDNLEYGKEFQEELEFLKFNFTLKNG